MKQLKRFIDEKPPTNTEFVTVYRKLSWWERFKRWWRNVRKTRE